MAVVELRGRVMASDLHHIVVPPRTGRVGQLDGRVRAVVSYLDHLERCWSRFVATSDISRINRLGPTGGGRISVDSSTLSLLASMVEGYERTAGRFDPTLLRAVIAEGYATSHVDPGLVTTVPDASAPYAAASLHDLEMDASTNTVVVPAGLTLDPGGIGKGFAADLAVARLLEAGAAGALVEIGGDLAMAGEPVDEAGWLVNVEWPEPADGILCSVAISGGGVATSSTRSRRWMLDGVERHHQIDPGTEHCSTTDLDAVTVIATTGWLAEVHATAALSAGSSGVLAYLDGHGLSGVAIGPDASPDPVMTTADLANVELRSRCGVR
jgi:thiamine biosynthesis lipoprotein